MGWDCKSWEGAQWQTGSGSLVRWFLPLFPCPAALSSPRDSFLPVLPATDRLHLSLSSHSSFPPPINNVVPLSPTPSPFPTPDGQHLISFVCLCVGGLSVLGLSCQGYRVRVDHLVIDKRMRSGEAGKLNSPLRYVLGIDSIPHDNDRYSIPLLLYLLRDNIILFHFIFFFTISFFSLRLETPCAGSNGTSIAEPDYLAIGTVLDKSQLGITTLDTTE